MLTKDEEKYGVNAPAIEHLRQTKKQCLANVEVSRKRIAGYKISIHEEEKFMQEQKVMANSCANALVTITGDATEADRG